jgi:hypothetical protein
MKIGGPAVAAGVIGHSQIAAARDDDSPQRLVADQVQESSDRDRACRPALTVLAMAIAAGLRKPGCGPRAGWWLKGLRRRHVAGFTRVRVRGEPARPLFVR